MSSSITKLCVIYKYYYTVIGPNITPRSVAWGVQGHHYVILIVMMITLTALVFNDSYGI